MLFEQVPLGFAPISFSYKRGADCNAGIMLTNNIGKAKTEKSSLLESSREKGIWWKPFMKEDR